ncbi:hypothetical protein [Vallitalea okinawensis]|uniref:hypothetical protein n=1 Tax=Vallitalea okinawensis TaxID=2078660 RepID=UPI000CFD4329|nr:hypothetical protein [Vallitalea okinawensis]
MSFKNKHKCDNIFERECECPVSTSQGYSGSFNLECGECLKIFESDEPVEIDMEVGQSSGNDCTIIVSVEVADEKNLEFQIPKRDSSGSNSISFNTKRALKITVACRSASLESGNCSVSWDIELILRGSDTDRSCECPISDSIPRSSSFMLKSSESQVIYQSDESAEIIFIVELFPSSSKGILTAIAELDNCSLLKFVIPTSASQTNRILFYSKNITKVTLECLISTNCSGVWFRQKLFRGA